MEHNYFSSLGYTLKEEWMDMSIHDGENNRKYRLRIPCRFYEKYGPWENVFSFDQRADDWLKENYNVLPILPAHLIKVFLKHPPSDFARLYLTMTNTQDGTGSIMVRLKFDNPPTDLPGKWNRLFGKTWLIEFNKPSYKDLEKALSPDHIEQIQIVYQ